MATLKDPNEVKRIMLGWKPEDMTVSLISKTFGHTTKKEPGKFNVEPPLIDVNMKIHLNKGEYINKTDIDTYAGRILWNKLMIEGRLEDIVPGGFLNEPVNGKTFKNLNQLIANAISEKKISVYPLLTDFLDDYEFWSLKLSCVFTPSISEGLINPREDLLAEKKRLIDNSPMETVQDMTKIEAELVKMAKDKTKDDPSIALFNSGARGSFDNDYKVMSLMVGSVQNPVTGDYDFISNSYLEGFAKTDLVAAGNAIVNAEYPKAIGTSRGGYMTKQFYAVYQAVTVNPDPESDCGSKGTLPVYLTKNNLDKYMYQYIREDDGKLVLLNEESSSKYVGKHVEMRSPMYCLDDQICVKCAGMRANLLDLENIGLMTIKVSNGMLQKSMKVRHAMSVSMNKVDCNKLLL